jgi:hypothetical protein
MDRSKVLSFSEISFIQIRLKDKYIIILFNHILEDKCVYIDMSIYIYIYQYTYYIKYIN